MSVKPLLERVDEEVRDVLNTGFEYSKTTSVPNSDDPGLTFERGETKKGKELETCVLYADIRDSVALNRKHHSQTMGRLYTVFTKAVIRAAEEHNAHVRNIIGDRVMIVFQNDNCFTNAVDCAITINHFSKYIINKLFTELNFKVGIGIDFGQLRVVKVGVEKKGSERSDNKNLVWVGYPANIASRLTDIANKTIQKEAYEVEYKPSNFRRIMGGLLGTGSTLAEIFNKEEEPLYLNERTEIMSKSKFAQKFSVNENGEIIFYPGKLISAEKTMINFNYPPILMTEKVFKAFEKANPNREKSITQNLWKPQEHDLNVVDGEIYGGDIHWTI